MERVVRIDFCVNSQACHDTSRRCWENYIIKDEVSTVCKLQDVLKLLCLSAMFIHITRECIRTSPVLDRYLASMCSLLLELDGTLSGNFTNIYNYEVFIFYLRDC